MEAVTKNKLKSPIAIEMIITEERLRKNEEEDDTVDSKKFKAFNIPGVQYTISIWSNDDRGHDGETWIYFDVEYDEVALGMEIEADVKILIETANFEVQMKRVFDSTNYEKIKCCKTNELFDPEKRFIVDGKMTIKMEGTLTIEKDETVEMKQELGDFSNSLGIDLWKQENKDFKFIAGEKEIAAHKLILATRSPVFARMFESGFKEAQENKVEIKDFDFEIVEAAIKLCYHQSLVTYISLEDKMKLLQFFDKYDIQQIKDHFETYLISTINELTVCRLSNCSILSNSTKLKTKCAEFLRDCLRKEKPISELDILDKDFAFDLFKNAFCHVSEND